MVARITNGKRAVTYCRMSGAKQEASIPRQLTEIKEYAAVNGFTIIDNYKDEAECGDATDRADFNRLIRDAQRGMFDVVLCWDRNRFSRFDTMTANHYWYLLRESGVGIVSVNQGALDFNDLSNVVMATIDQHASNKFLKDLSRVVCSGLRGAARSGHRTARPAYGYKNSGKGLTEINPDHAETVRFMFEAVLTRDIGVRTLAAELTAKRIPSPYGKPAWNQCGVKTILANPAYIGVKVYGRRPAGKHFRLQAGEVVPIVGRSGGRAKQDLADCIVTKGAYPPIIDEATFNAVQEILGRRSQPAARTRQTSYLLSGHIFCGECGRRCTTLVCTPSGRRTKPYFYYCCTNRQERGAKNCPECCKLLARGERVEAMVKHYINTQLLTDAKIAELANWQREHLGQIRSQAAGQRKTLDKRFEAAAAKVGKLESRLASAPDDMIDALYKQIRTAKADRDAVAMELSAINSLSEKTDAAARESAKDNVARLTKYRELINNGPPDVVRRVIANVVDSIAVFSKPATGRKGRPTRTLERIDVEFKTNLFCGTESYAQITSQPTKPLKATIWA